MEIRNKKEEAVFIETGQYLYQNQFIAFLNRLGHLAVQKLVRNKKGMIIDLGCGMGDHFPYMKNCSFIGIDVDENMINLAKSRYPFAKLSKGSVYKLPFKNEYFDCALAIGVLEHLSDLEAALIEIRRILKPSGEFIVLIPTENFLYKLGRQLTVKRHIEKKYDIDYNRLVKSEHVNNHSSVIGQLDNSFRIDKKIGVPFIFPFYSFNVFTIIRCLK